MMRIMLLIMRYISGADSLRMCLPQCPEVLAVGGILVMLFPTGWTGGLYWIWQPMEKRLIKFHRHGS